MSAVAIKDARAGRSFNLESGFQCINANRNELSSVHQMACAQFGAGVSSLKAMTDWYDKNPEIFAILHYLRNRQYRIVSEMVGYHCVIPLTTAAAERMLAGEMRSAQLLDRDIERPDTHCRAVFIGALVGTTVRARASILSLLHRELTGHHAKYAQEFLTRPVTADGLRIVEKFGFLPADLNPSGGIDALYKYRPMN